MKVRGLKTSTPMGMGCWAIGGPFYAGNSPLGFSDVNDKQSKRTINAALDAGIKVFDTAAVYGAGHSETLLGQVVGSREDISIITKMGIPFDESTKQLIERPFLADDVLSSIEASRHRLQRDVIDVVLLHQNELSVEDAKPLFEAMERARQSGIIGSFGWSTDFPASVRALSDEPGFTSVEHAMNVFVDVPTMVKTMQDTGLDALIRSPLAMGVLTGKYRADTKIAEDDIRATHAEWRDYFVDAKVKTEYLEKLNNVRELLKSGGRTVSQGSLAWLWSKSPRNIPIPGARTEQQIIENSAAMDFGPLPQSVMEEIESVIQRPDEGEARAR